MFVYPEQTHILLTRFPKLIQRWKSCARNCHRLAIDLGNAREGWTMMTFNFLNPSVGFNRSSNPPERITVAAFLLLITSPVSHILPVFFLQTSVLHLFIPFITLQSPWLSCSLSSQGVLLRYAHYPSRRTWSSHISIPYLVSLLTIAQCPLPTPYTVWFLYSLLCSLLWATLAPVIHLCSNSGHFI